MPDSGEIEIPAVVPVMRLPEAVLFPRAIMPLYIFEPRYRQMLRETLSDSQVFAIALNPEPEEIDEPALRDDSLPPRYDIATVGLIRASQQNADGTSHLILQGLQRVRILEETQQEPYPMIRVSPCPSQVGQWQYSLEDLQRHLLSLIGELQPALPQIPPEFLDYLSEVNDLSTLVDLTAFSCCASARLKQELLETLDLQKRYHRLEGYLHHFLQEEHWLEALQRDIPDDQIGRN